MKSSLGYAYEVIAANFAQWVEETRTRAEHAVQSVEHVRSSILLRLFAETTENTLCGLLPVVLHETGCIVSTCVHPNGVTRGALSALFLYRT